MDRETIAAKARLLVSVKMKKDRLAEAERRLRDELVEALAHVKPQSVDVRDQHGRKVATVLRVDGRKAVRATDEAKLVAWAKEHAPELVRIVETVDVKALSADERARIKRRRVAFAGSLVPGVAVEDVAPTVRIVPARAIELEPEPAIEVERLDALEA